MSVTIALPDLAPGDFGVYQCFGEDGSAIYVGCSSRPLGRLVSHSYKEWWPGVTRVEVEAVPDKPTALAREAELIRALRPKFNIQHNPDNKPRGPMHGPQVDHKTLFRALLDDLVESERVTPEWAEWARDLVRESPYQSDHDYALCVRALEDMAVSA